MSPKEEPSTPEQLAVLFITEYMNKNREPNLTERLYAKWWPNGAPPPGERLGYLLDQKPEPLKLVP